VPRAASQKNPMLGWEKSINFGAPKGTQHQAGQRGGFRTIVEEGRRSMAWMTSNEERVSTREGKGGEKKRPSRKIAAKSRLNQRLALISTIGPS